MCIRDRYEGEWKRNQAHGRGKFWHIDGDVFEGEWKDDKANGHGVYTHKNGTRYEGCWKDDFQHGYGVETWADNSRYEGEYVDGRKEGEGVYYWPDGSQYSGQWIDNKIHGRVSFEGKAIRGHTSGRTGGCTRGSGRATTCTGTESTHGRTAENTRVRFKLTARRVLHGQEARTRHLHVGRWKEVRRNVGEREAAWRGGLLRH
eukprot:TRINITY_DN5887_c0_g1_i20.p1 TRINITY_DN5887_c0_g1~~TRINITY_DN5887_c0_g1_i20.p1  ORF type:complete len:203 (-),score=11.65 TRINITY_DN5887_c0_g1_i20:222-830(-)